MIISRTIITGILLEDLILQALKQSIEHSELLADCIKTFMPLFALHFRNRAKRLKNGKPCSCTKSIPQNSFRSKSTKIFFKIVLWNWNWLVKTLI